MVARGLRHHRGLRAAPAPLRGQQRLPRPHRRKRACSSPAPRRTVSWSSSSSCPPTCTRSSSATQAHPELKSRPTRPHPLFAAFIGAALDYKAAERLPVEIPEQRANGAEHPDDAEQLLQDDSGRNPKSVAEHDFETVDSETALRRKDFRAARRRGADARRQHRQTRSRRALRRGRHRSRSTTTTTSCWSTSTAIRWAGGCGSCPPGCSTSAASRRTSPRHAS